MPSSFDDALVRAPEDAARGFPDSREEESPERAVQDGARDATAQIQNLLVASRGSTYALAPLVLPAKYFSHGAGHGPCRPAQAVVLCVRLFLIAIGKFSAMLAGGFVIPCSQCVPPASSTLPLPMRPRVGTTWAHVIVSPHAMPILFKS